MPTTYNNQFFGNGGRTPIGPQLSLNPASLAFGDVTQTQTAALPIVITNTGDTLCTISSIVSDNGSFVVTGTPASIAAGASATITVTYTAGAPGAATGNLTISSDAINDPVGVGMTGTSVAAGSQAISVSPSSIVFPTTKVGLASAAQIFTITNTGTVNITVTNPLTVAAPFTLTVDPTPVTLVPGGNATFQVTFNPVSAGYVVNATGAIVATSGGPTFNVDLEGQAVLITPAYTTNLGTDRTAAAFGSTVSQFNETDFNCEEAGKAYRWHDFGLVGLPKNYDTLMIQHEDLGAASLNITGRNHTDSKQVSVALGDNNSNDLLDAAATLNVPYSESMEIRIDRNALAGPVSIVKMIHIYDQDGPYIGTVQLPVTITPAFIQNGSESTLFAFSNASVLKCNETDFNCEEASSAVRERTLSQPGFEDSALRYQLNIEDYGAVLTTITAANRRSQPSSQPLTLGGANDKDIHYGLFDLDVADEVITFTISRAANGGPLVITGHVVRFIPRGEIVNKNL